MQKTSLGISVTLLGAALYFIGLINYLALIILAGYVLIFETNEWLRRSAVKAVVIIVVFSLVSVVIGFGSDIFGIFNVMLSWFKSPVRLSWPLNLGTILIDAANAGEKLVLLILGFKSFTQGSLSLGFIDKVINKNIKL